LYTSTFALVGRFSSRMALGVACMRMFPVASCGELIGVFVTLLDEPPLMEDEDGIVSVLELLDESPLMEDEDGVTSALEELGVTTGAAFVFTCKEAEAVPAL